MITTFVDIDREALEEARKTYNFIGVNSSEALRIAINKTAPKIKTLASRQIRTQIRLSAAYVRKTITVKKASRANMTAYIRTANRGILLSRFSTDPVIANPDVRWFRPPRVVDFDLGLGTDDTNAIKVQIKPKGQPVAAPKNGMNKPFYMVLKNSRAIGIAARIGNTKKVKVFHGPSISQVFSDVRNDIMPDARDELTAQMVAALKDLTRRRFTPEGADE